MTPVEFLRRCRHFPFHENWMIGIIDRPIEDSLNWTECPPVRWIGPRSSKRYLADPFAWPGKTGLVLCEAYDFATRKGRIVKLQLHGDAIVKEEPLDIPIPGHLSFPFLFEEGGQVYALMESSQARLLSLLRWADDKGWETTATILADVGAADSVLFRHGGLLWIAYTDIDLGPFDNLNLCFAPSLAGPWTRHAANPVKRDPRSARCGGQPFTVAGQLYRPAQDCVGGYGVGLRIMRIADCTPTSYAEEEVSSITPGRGRNPHGLHTLSAYGPGQCLVDGKRLMFLPGQVIEKIRWGWHARGGALKAR